MVATPNPSVDFSEALRLAIHPQYAQQVLDFFLKNQIPFQVAYNRPSSLVSTVAAPIHSNPIPEKIPFVETNDDVMGQVYRTYIVEGVRQTPPKERELAKLLNMSYSTFQNRFKQKYQTTFYQAYLSYKMTYAAKLLKQGHRANKVANMVGYSEKSGIKFNKMFQKHFGITPKKYQMNKRN